MELDQFEDDLAEIFHSSIGTEIRAYEDGFHAFVTNVTEDDFNRAAETMEFDSDYVHYDWAKDENASGIIVEVWT